MEPGNKPKHSRFFPGNSDPKLAPELTGLSENPAVESCLPETGVGNKNHPVPGALCFFPPGQWGYPIGDREAKPAPGKGSRSNGKFPELGKPPVIPKTKGPPFNSKQSIPRKPAPKPKAPPIPRKFPGV